MQSKGNEAVLPFFKKIFIKHLMNKCFQDVSASENTHDPSLEFGTMTNAGETNAYDIPGF